MDNTAILKTIQMLMEDIFDRSPIAISENTTANDIEEWDSLNHVQLVVAVEKHFKVKFSASEIQQWKNVGEICGSIEKKLSGI